MVKKKIVYFFLFYFILIIFKCIHPSSNIEFYVSPKGSEKNPGTKSQPFKSIQQAQKAVRSLIYFGQKKNIVVKMRGGIYRLDQPLTFDLKDSGNDEFSVTYQAYPGEKAEVSGGRIIYNWQLEEDGTWATSVPSVQTGGWHTRELFVNGKRAIRARHPNQGFFRLVEPGADRRTYFSFNPGEIKSYPDIREVELVYTHDWSISRIPLKSVDEEQSIVTLAYPLGAAEKSFWMMWKNERYLLENCVDFLDEAGEWCFNNTSARLKYKPISGESIEGTEVVSPSADVLVIVCGDKSTQQPVKNLHFEGIIFEHCSYIIPEKGYRGIQAAFHSSGENQTSEQWKAMPAAILFNLTENSSIKNCVIRHLGGSGIWLGQQTRHNCLVGNHLYDISGNGIMVGEDHSREIKNKPWWEVAPQEAASDNIIENNVIEKCGIQFFGSVGIWVGLAEKTVIRSNEICFLPYTGISLGWMWNPTPTPCQENIVENNHIHHVMQILSDGGGIYTLGLQPGSILRGNFIHDVPLNVGRAESNGIFLDEGTSGFVVENNLIYNIDKSPIRFHKAITNVVQNNFIGISETHPMIRYNNTKEEDVKKFNNIVFDSKAGIPSEKQEVKKIQLMAGLTEEFKKKIQK
jgi:hypothetical protein